MKYYCLVLVLFYTCANIPTTKLLRFEPENRAQVWRYLTYMVLHYSATHLALNVGIQLFVTVPLAAERQAARTAAVYAFGGVCGALGACLVQPQPVIGASAGIYALLASHLAHLYLNFDVLHYRKFRVFSVFLLATSDVAFYVFYPRSPAHPTISLSAHASGGLAGFLIGLVLYKHAQNGQNYLGNYVRIIALVTVVCLFAISIGLIIVLPSEHFSR